LELKDLVDLYKTTSFTSYKKGGIIAKKGQVFPYVIGIRKGVIRTYILKEDGEEKTIRFAKENDFTTCALSMLKNQPSTEYLDALEDCKVILFDSEKIRKLTAKNIRILRLWNELVMEAFLESIHRIEFFVTLSPEERYRHLLESSPDLIIRIPQKYLASFIGVTTVSLSRIRSRVAQSE
jgi:CRP-like cAMP-binding protein